MRVIDQARLAFREGSSDKVYEIDLVEVVPGQHVVNFRFGRRGSALTDGTKTATPVPLAKARAIYDKLLAEKLAGGYRAIGAPGSAPPSPEGSPHAGTGADDAADDDALIAQLRRGHRGDGPLGPVVWRVADRDLRAAEPALLELIDVAPRGVAAPAWQYTVIGALVRCGSSASLRTLAGIADDAKRPRHVRDVARLAIARIDPARGRELARPLLAPPLAAALDRRDPGALARAAEELLASDPVRAQAAAVALLLLGDPIARPVIFALARIARLSNPEAAVVRTLFRFAELLRDGELYALCARRIDAHTGERPFGPLTVRYFRRRVARVLRRLGRAGSPDYVRLASALLLSYSEDDAQPELVTSSGSYDRFARYHALNDVVYGRSPRYERAHHDHATWRCKTGHAPGGRVPDVREERFPERWDAAPEALWHLLVAGRAAPVLELATRALVDHRAFVDAVPDEQVAEVLAGGHPVAQRFAFRAAERRAMSVPLARGALASELVEAHAWVLAWIARHPESAAADPEVIALLLTGRTAAVRESGLSLLRGRALPDAIARSAAARSIAVLLGLDPAAEGAAARAAGSTAALLQVLEAPLRTLAAEVLRDLARHPLAALGELAGELALRHLQRDRLPGDLIDLLLASPHPTVRTLGGRLLATTPVEIAKDDLDALELFATSANRELREATRGLLGELARRYPEIARTLAGRLLDGLLRPQPDGAPAHVVSLLRDELAAALPALPSAAILRLIGALSPHAREAGGLLLLQLDPDQLGLDDLARLASHEVLAIRRGAWSLAERSVARYRIAPVAVSRLIDSPWEDTRAFASALIRDQLAEHLTADAIIAICDSIRPEVQQLGKALLHERFQTADAGRYLVRLAEHPSTNLQLLVSGLLEHHVAGDLERLRALAPYLVTILSQVNRGRVAKQRVIQLIAREAARSREAAELLAPILDRQSATVAIEQKHPLIATMVEVRAAFPEVPLPIEIATPPSAARLRGDG
ncbi:MAG: hypothetical protein ACTHU0_24090 [Kofleriaceae bacterium]